MAITDAIARLAVSVSSQVVMVLAIAAGLTLVLARSDGMLVLALLVSYLAATLLLAGLTGPELSLVTLLVGVFVSLVMQLTASDRKAAGAGEHSTPASITIRVLMCVLMFWFALSLGLFRQPSDPWVFTEVWLGVAAGAALLTSTDPFRVGVSLLMVVAATMLFYASSSSEVSLLVHGLIAACAFAISLSASHLALERDAGATG